MVQEEKAQILIVDDRPENLFAMQELLRDMPVEVYTATSGNDALKLTLVHDFALVLLDVQMPDMDGFETATLMRQNDAVNIPLIFVTAISKEEEHVFKGYGAGAVDYLFKPINPDILRSKVQVFSQLYLARKKCSRMERELQNVRNLDAIGVLAGGIAHDFNNLLTVIMGAIQLVSQELPSAGKARALLDKATAASRQAEELAKRLLTFARGDMLRIREMALGPVANEVAGEVLASRGIVFENRLSDSLPPVKADYAQFRHLLSNLFLNAAEAMPSGGKVFMEAEVVEAGPDGRRQLVISVGDEGKGIAEEDLPYIFDPYFSTKEMGTKRGMGLGLAICYSIVKKHGGSISVSSQVGRGSVFRINLPYSGKVVAAAAPAAQESPDVKVEGKRILVLDDEELVRGVAAEILSVLGYAVEVATHGEEALEKYEKALAGNTPFAAVILDLTIPGGMGGLDTLRHLRAMDPGVRAVVSSGYASGGILGDYRQHGFCASVHKPYSMEAMRQAMESVVGSAAQPARSGQTLPAKRAE